jgi:S1-C subfamily serine protease
MSVDPASAASDAGVQAGDVIQRVNRQMVTTVAGFERTMQVAGGQPVLLLINRNGLTTFLVVQPQ